MKQLPVWQGMTVDKRLREFRWFDESGNLRRLSWDTTEGALLHAEMKGDIKLEVQTSPSGLTFYRIMPEEEAK